MRPTAMKGTIRRETSPKAIRTIFLIGAAWALAPSLILAQQAPAIEWQRCYGGSSLEEGHAIIQTADGGYAVAGASQNTQGNWFVFVVKTDANGNIQWQRNLGGNGTDKAYAVRQTMDGGYIVVGITSSNNGDVSGNNGGGDSWVVKLDAGGVIDWQRCLGGPGGETAYDVLLQPDGGYLVASGTNASGGDVSEHFGGADYWFVKIDDEGDILWEKSFGGSGTDLLSRVLSTQDGGFIAVGSTQSTDGHVTNPLGDWDRWVVKLDAGGNMEWQRTYGGSGGDGGSSVVQMEDGGYMIGGSTNSVDGDVTDAFGGNDAWLVRTDAEGNILWQKSYGGSGDESIRDLVALDDGGVLAFGSTNSTDGDINGHQGGNDYWVFRVDAEGAMLWQRCLGGTGDDRGASLTRTDDAGYALVGISASSNGDVTSAFPGYDIWVVKLATDPTGVSEHGALLQAVLLPNPALDQVSLRITLQSPAKVEAHLINSTGQLVQTMTRQAFPAGEHLLAGTLLDLPAGFYLVRLVVNDAVFALRLVKM